MTTTQDSMPEPVVRLTAAEKDAIAEHVAYCGSCADEGRRDSPLGWCDQHMGPALRAVIAQRISFYLR